MNRNGRKRGGLGGGRLPSPGKAASKLKLPKPKRPSIKRPEVDADAALRGLGRAAETVAARSEQVGAVASQLRSATEAIRKSKG